jgi:DNA-binding CsgD family transcriptional regulator
MWRASAFVPAHPAGSMLSTHLPIHEIAAEMVLSSHTVRTQGKSIYRKPGAASHS